MTTISIFTPINFTRPKSCGEETLSKLSNYFYLGGTQATVIKGNEVKLENGKISWKMIALKVASYVILFPITLTLLAIDLVLRTQYHFIVISPSKNPGLNSTISNKVPSEDGKNKPAIAAQNSTLTKIEKHANKQHTWRETFKQNALDHFDQVQKEGRIKEEPPVLNLTEQQQVALRNVLEKVLSCYENEVKKLATLHGRNGTWVFSLNEIPGWIFKCNPQDIFTESFEENQILKRQIATQKAKEVVERENLTLLHVPVQEVLTFDDLEENKIYVLAEQKYDILGNFEKQEALFHYCIHDEVLKPVIQEYVRQIVILILETGYMDVRHDNNPILANGQGIALIDMDTSFSPLCGLLSGCSSTGEDGILRNLTPELIESVEPLIREKLTDEQFTHLDLDAIKQSTKVAEEKVPNFLQYLKEHKVETGKETVLWQRFKHPWETRYVRELQEEVNAVARKNMGICPLTERKFFMYGAFNDSIELTLKKLKEEGKIFDWRKPQTECGYYIWC